MRKRNSRDLAKLSAIHIRVPIPNGVQLQKEKIVEPRMGKPTICIGENKGADQLRSNCEADQRLCFRNTDSTIPLLSIKNPKFPASIYLL